MSLTRAFAALTGASAVSMAANLVRGKLAALFLGPAGVGVFNQLSLMWNLFHIGGSLGAANGIIQHGAEALANDDLAALRRLASTSALLLGGLACLLAAIGVALAPQLSDLVLDDGGEHATLVRLILLSVPLGVTGLVYRSLLSAARGVGPLVRTQIASDIGGATVFALLIVPLGLAGAILGFMATHLIFLVMAFARARRLLGRDALRPRPSEFRWSVVRSNVGFGASGLVMIALSNLSVLFVSRLVISHFGLDANGIFSNAWRIASIYLGAVTATTISYYLPTLTRCETAEEMGREVNATLRFYLYALPLPMVGIMALSEPLVWLILSREFLAVAPLLLIFVPAELMRIVGETPLMVFLARKRVALFTLLYALQPFLFVIVAWLLLPALGLRGAAFAYGVGVFFEAAASMVAARIVFGIRLDLRTIRALLFAALLLLSTAAICAFFPLDAMRIALCAAVASGWVAITLADDEARTKARGLLARLSA